MAAGDTALDDGHNNAPFWAAQPERSKDDTRLLSTAHELLEQYGTAIAYEDSPNNPLAEGSSTVWFTCINAQLPNGSRYEIALSTHYDGVVADLGKSSALAPVLNVTWRDTSVDQTGELTYSLGTPPRTYHRGKLGDRELLQAWALSGGVEWPSVEDGSLTEGETDILAWFMERRLVAGVYSPERSRAARNLLYVQADDPNPRVRSVNDGLTMRTLRDPSEENRFVRLALAIPLGRATLHLFGLRTQTIHA